jgi:hypothetical protein
MSTKDHFRGLAALSRRIGKRTRDTELATMFKKIAAEYDRRADEESGDEPPRDPGGDANS